MATIAELQTKLTVDNTEFQRGINKSAESVQQFANKAKIGFAIAAAAIAGTLIVAFNQLSNVMDESQKRVSDLVDTSSRLGIGIPELQRLRFAAEQSGLSVETLDRGLSRFTKNLGDAAAGSTSAADKFERLGLSVEKLMDMSIDQQYVALSDALKKVTNDTQRAAIAYDIFGRSGIEQLSLLRDNVSGLMKSFTDMGAELTGPQAVALRDYGDKMARLGTLWDAFKDQLAAALAGPFSEMLDWTTESIVAWGGLRNVALNTAEAIIGGIDLTISAMQQLAGLQDEIKKNFLAIQIIGMNERLQESSTSDKERVKLGGMILDLHQQIEAIDNRSAQGLLSTIRGKLDDLRKRLEETPAGSVADTDFGVEKQITSELDKQITRNRELNALADQRLAATEGLLGALNNINSSQQSLNDKRKELEAERAKGEDNRFRGVPNAVLSDLEKQVADLEKSSGLNRINEKTLQNLNKQTSSMPEFQSSNILAQKLGQLGEQLNKLSAKDSQTENVRQQVEVKIDAGPGFVATVVNSTENRTKIIEVVNTSITDAARGEQR